MSRRSRPAVLMSPRNEENPYLPRLRIALEHAGCPTGWFEMETTPISTLNALLAPFELLIARLRGAKVLHLHWAYRFAWGWTKGRPRLGRLAVEWYGLTLRVARALGIKVVLTWHDVLPLNQVFEDDRRGRVLMAKHHDAIIAITNAAKAAIVADFAVPASHITVIPEGAPTIGDPSRRHEARHALGVSTGPLLSVFGHIDRYKGIDLLLEAARSLPREVDATIVIMGKAVDSSYGDELIEAARRVEAQGHTVHFANARFRDAELLDLLVASDFVVIPFRYITNSTTARMAMAHGCEVVLPDLDALSDVPRDAAWFFTPGDAASLGTLLSTLTRQWPAAIDRRGDAAASWASAWSWDEVGEATASVYAHVLGGEKPANR